jgi:hypothetical protein
MGIHRQIYRPRHGMVLFYAAIMMLTLFAMASLAIDLGRVQVAKSQMERATEAAALYGCSGASDGTASSKAITAAADNKVDGSPLVLLSSDIQTITWNNGTGTYSIGGSSPNGVKITAMRTKARGTAIPLLFAKAIGMPTCDIHYTAVAVYRAGLPAYGFVGINSAMLQNNTILVDSYSSGNGTYGGANILTHGYVATNGSFAMSSAVNINTDIYMLSGQTLTANGAPAYGTRQTLSSALSFPSIASAPGGAINVGNINGATTLGSGSNNTDYYTTGISVLSGQTLTIAGPVTLYVNGNFQITGIVKTYLNLPVNFTIRVIASSGVNITTASMYADVYAPTSPINIGAGTGFYGRAIGNQFSVNGAASLHYDEGLPALPGTPQQPPSSGSGGASGTATLE